MRARLAFTAEQAEAQLRGELSRTAMDGKLTYLGFGFLSSIERCHAFLFEARHSSYWHVLVPKEKQSAWYGHTPAGFHFFTALELIVMAAEDGE
jgi:hypothetical protein